MRVVLRVGQSWFRNPVLMLDAEASFARSERLLKPAEYRAVFSCPVKSADRCFTVLCCPNGKDISRLGLAISKKNSRLAVDRNRIKRVIRESFRHNKGMIGGLDCVVLSRKDSNRMDNKELLASLDKHWVRLRKKVVVSDG